MNRLIVLLLTTVLSVNLAAQTIEEGNGIDIHKAGLNNLTGKTLKGGYVSEGCLLIDIDRWDEFMGLFNSPAQKNNIISVTVLRQ
ncbi:MAG: hypothetical protein IKR72_00225 [Bacteroidales bacterium]|nr:hypothetical protein [Bacteroidales bacterium]